MKATVLIADDSLLIRTMVGSMLSDMGHDLLTAENGISAVRAAFSHMPDLIIMDINMPGINGFQACRLLKKEKQTSRIPIIILTGEKQPINQFWGREVGADSYIVKSEDTGPLSEAVTALLEKNRDKRPERAAGLQDLTELQILAKVSQLLDQELNDSTLEKIKLESITKNINEALIIIDETDRMKQINDAGLTLFGLRAKGWEQMKIQDILPDARLTFKDLSSPLVKEHLLNRELTLRSGGQEHNLLVDFSLIKNFQSRIEAIVIFFREITYLKEIERMKGEYLYNVVQEIRNPLTSAKSAIDFIKSDAPDNLTSTQQTLIKMVEEEVHRLIRLADKMISISDMDLSSSLLHIKSLDPVSLLSKAFEKNQKMADLKSLKVRMEYPEESLRILGDRDKLIEVFSSIFSNAVKFNSANGTISVLAASAEKQGRRFVHITIQDTGCGIDPDELELLFDKNKKVDARQRKKGGEFGMSMVVAKMILDLHKSDISVKSEPGRGTAVSIWIPLEAETETRGDPVV